MTNLQKIGLTVLVLVGLNLIVRLFQGPSPQPATNDVPEATQVTTAVTMCDLAMNDFADRLAGTDDTSQIGRYEAALQAEADCRDAYLKIGKLPQSGLTEACQEAMSVKRFAAKQAVRLFEDETTPKKFVAFKTALADAPKAVEACALALKLAQSGPAADATAPHP